MMISEAITQEQIDVGASLRDEIRRVSPNEANSAIGVITSAFSTDPVARWMYPDPADYFMYFPSFIRGFAGAAFEAGTAFQTPDGSGAALWLAPGTETDSDPLIDLFWESTSGEVQEDLFPVFEMMGEMHPVEPHWYLPMIGVDTYRQGFGAGSALMNHAVAMIDEAGLSAYLESSNPRNIPLYERYGFSVTGIIEHGKCPPIYPMYRPSR